MKTSMTPEMTLRQYCEKNRVLFPRVIKLTVPNRKRLLIAGLSNRGAGFFLEASIAAFPEPYQAELRRYYERSDSKKYWQSEEHFIAICYALAHGMGKIHLRSCVGVSSTGKHCAFTYLENNQVLPGAEMVEITDILLQNDYQYYAATEYLFSFTKFPGLFFGKERYHTRIVEPIYTNGPADALPKPKTLSE